MGAWLFASVVFASLIFLLFKSPRFRYWFGVSFIGAILVGILGGGVAWYLHENTVKAKTLIPPDKVLTEMIMLPDLRPKADRPQQAQFTMYGVVTNSSQQEVRAIKLRTIVYDCPSEDSAEAKDQDPAVSERKPRDLFAPDNKQKYRIVGLPPMTPEALTMIPEDCIIIGDQNVEWSYIAIPPKQRRKLASTYVEFADMPTMNSWKWRYAVVEVTGSESAEQ